MAWIQLADGQYRISAEIKTNVYREQNNCCTKHNQTEPPPDTTFGFRWRVCCIRALYVYITEILIGKTRLRDAI